MKKLPKSIQTRIAEINAMIPQVEILDEIPFTYNGGTWPYYVEIQPIEIKGLKVIIKAKDQKPDNHNFITLQKYNAKDQDFFSDNGLIGLKYDLSVILKAFKKALN
jgi:hypothetical protein